MNNIYNFPSGITSNEEKKSNEFGEKVAKAIFNEWFSSDKFVARRNWIDRMRQHASGEHDMQYYEKWFCGNDNKSHSYKKFINVDFKERCRILPNKLDIIKNNIHDFNFEPQANSIDPSNKEIKKEKLIKKIALVKSKQLIKDAEQYLGIKTIDPDTIPESEDEVMLDSLLNGKEKIEKAEELLIKSIFLDNDIKNKNKRFIDDLVELGMMSAHIRTDRNYGILIDYNDPYNYIHSKTDDPYFLDCNYHGVIKRLSVSEIKKISTIDLSTELLKKATTHHTSFIYQKDFFADDNNKIDTLFFSYLTHHDDMYVEEENAFGNKRLIYKKNKKFNKEKDKENRINDVYDVWYNGVAILNTSENSSYDINNLLVIKWERAENMPLNPLTSKPLPPFITIAPNYKSNKPHSVLERAIQPFIEAQKLDLKIQHLSSELRPSTIDVDVSIFNGITTKDGDKIPAEDLFGLYFGKGIRLSQQNDDSMLPQTQRQLQESNAPATTNLERSVDLYRFRVQQMKEALGLNDATDNVNSNPKTLVAVQEIARLNSNTALKHLVDGFLDFHLMISKNISYSLNNVYKWSSTLKEKYNNIIGTDDIINLEVLKGRPSSYFGIYIDYIPTTEDIMSFNTDLNTALQTGGITIDDLITLKRIKNIKIAENLLRVRLKINKKQQQEEGELKAQQQININSQSAIVKQEEERKTIELKYAKEMDLLEAQSFYTHQRLKMQTEMQIGIDNNDIEGRLKLAEISAVTQFERDRFKKDREEETRLNVVNQQAKNKSELTEQNKYGVLPSFRRFNPMEEVNQSNSIASPITSPS